MTNEKLMELLSDREGEEEIAKRAAEIVQRANEKAVIDFQRADKISRERARRGGVARPQLVAT